MLDFMRRHASSWIVKLILGGIISSFILFFGYSTLNENFQNENDIPVARVGEQTISTGLFRFFLDQNAENFFRGGDRDALPDAAKKLLQSMTLRQLVGRTSLIEQAKKSGITVSDNELAAHITQTHRDEHGNFDPIFYRHQYLPAMNQRYGIDYEQVQRDNLILQKTIALFGDQKLPFPAPLPESAFLDEWMTATLTRGPVTSFLDQQ